MSSDDTPPEDQSTHTSNQTTTTFSRRALLQSSAFRWSVVSPEAAQTADGAAWKRPCHSLCGKGHVGISATIPLGGIKSPLTTGLFTAPPAPTNAHEKPPTSQPLLDVLHRDELEGDG